MIPAPEGFFRGIFLRERNFFALRIDRTEKVCIIEPTLQNIRCSLMNIKKESIMKTLDTIQALSKIGKILSTIVFVCCIIGAAGCILGMLCLPIADSGILKIGGVTIHGIIANRADMELNALYPMLLGALIVCAGQAVTAKFAERYFHHELAAGTPFTQAGAKELLRLGILTICVPLGCLIFAQIFSSILAELIGCGEALKLDGDGSVTLGVMFLVASLLCRYGAETNTEKET